MFSDWADFLSVQCRMHRIWQNLCIVHLFFFQYRSNPAKHRYQYLCKYHRQHFRISRNVILVCDTTICLPQYLMLKSFRHNVRERSSVLSPHLRKELKSQGVHSALHPKYFRSNFSVARQSALHLSYALLQFQRYCSVPQLRGEAPLLYCCLPVRLLKHLLF